MRRVLYVAILLCASAIGAHAADDWNAMALDDDTLNVGMASSQPSQQQAEDTAKQQCMSAGGKSCSTVFAREGGCLAISRDESGSSVGIGMEDTIEETVVEALKQCINGGKHPSCTVHTNYCSGTGS
ncbi:DUF4189 domain-containing protein [Martelella alba]|uniref:DUF4189 domain-containing protein n=1 Tax=Martelella alba TaxID=2590451 RepID=A0A506U8I1_9HYPH|nr:DUF4189 domain-containing protein [Martelella alba]TPW29411.1 DUF4189 domain-containing protein [Martelella alba]